MPFDPVVFIERIFQGPIKRGSSGNPPMIDICPPFNPVDPELDLRFFEIHRINYAFCPIPINWRRRQLILGHGRSAYKTTRRLTPCYVTEKDTDASISTVDITEAPDTNPGIYMFYIRLNRPLPIMATLHWELLPYGPNPIALSDFIYGQIRGFLTIPARQTTAEIKLSYDSEYITDQMESFAIRLYDWSNNLTVNDPIKIIEVTMP